MEKREDGRRPRRLEELNLMDDFLFQEMLSQEGVAEEFCRILLETILGRSIRQVKVIPQKSILGIDTDRHGIRMDAYIEEVSEECSLSGSPVVDAQVSSDIYDIEPENRREKDTLPRRMRYYHGLIDTQMLESGASYDRMQNVTIIVILPYDPFGKNRMVYTVCNQCTEDQTVSYEDGAKNIFLYTKGREGNPSQDLRDMLKYIEETTIDNVTNQRIADVNRLVEKVKESKEVGINYMKSWEREKIAREEAIREGLAEGLAEGLEKGRQEGIEEGKTKGKVELLLALLEENGTIPDVLRERIMSEECGATLTKWVRLASTVEDMAEFERRM